MKTPVKIMLVEDNPGDVMLATKILKELKTASQLVVVRDGIEAMQYLSEEIGKAEAMVLPGLILLDLNLPRKDGRELLKEIKSHPSLKRIPVIVFTTSSADSDVFMSYEYHANSYVRKPVTLDEFRGLMMVIEAFWLGAAILPPSEIRFGP